MTFLVPNANSAAGLVLSAANWREAGVVCLALDFDTLLFRPGFATLQQKGWSYFAWNNEIVLDARMLKIDPYGLIYLKSPFDGSKLRFSILELQSMLYDLQPKYVLLPTGISAHKSFFKQWPVATTPFFALEDLGHNSWQGNAGVYLNSQQWAEEQQWQGHPHCLLLEHESEILNLKPNTQVDFIVSDIPAQMAVSGKIIAPQGYMDIAHQAQSETFVPIDKECSCSTCKLYMTQAYLHHIYHHVPLLAQRFLIQHNMHAYVLKLKTLTHINDLHGPT